MSRFRPRDEYEALVYVIGLLAREHPSVDEATIVEIMAEELEAFSRATIREFIPQLVEGRTRRRLREEVALGAAPAPVPASVAPERRRRRHHRSPAGLAG